MKLLFVSFILLIVSIPAGCGITDTSSIELAGKAIDRIPQDIGRFSSHSVTRAAEEATKQKVVEMKKAMADAEKAQAEAEKMRDSGVTVVLDTPEKISSWSLASLGRQLAESNKMMAKAFQSFAEKGENPYQLATTPTPKGVFAESLDSLGGAVAKIADTPAAVASAVGITAVKMTGAMAEEIGDKVTVNGDENTVTTTKTKTTTSNTTTGAESPVKVEQAAPVAEEEMIEEPIVEEVVKQ